MPPARMIAFIGVRSRSSGRRPADSFRSWAAGIRRPTATGPRPFDSATRSKTSTSRATWRSNDCSRPSRWPHGPTSALPGPVVGHPVEGVGQVAAGVGVGDDEPFAPFGDQLARPVARGRDHREAAGERLEDDERARVVIRRQRRRSRSPRRAAGCRPGTRPDGPSRPIPRLRDASARYGPTVAPAARDEMDRPRPGLVASRDGPSPGSAGRGPLSA